MPTIEEAVAAAEQGRTVRAGGLDQHYHEAGDGPPVIFLHGGGPGASGWSNYGQSNLPAFAPHFRTILVDQPGFGKSGLPVIDRPRWEVNAIALEALVDELGIDKVSLVGNSMGGGVALYYALRNPDRVDRLVLMGAVYGAPFMFSSFPPAGLKVVFEAFADPSAANLRRMYDAMLFDSSVISDDMLQARAEAAAASRAQRESFLADAKKGIPVSVDLTGDLPKISAPTMILHGRNDSVVPYEQSLRLVSGIPDSRLVMFNQCGHWVQYEKAAEFNFLVKSFLGAHG